MAAGHAKYTGEVGVCLATQGPGAAHLLAGLEQEGKDRAAEQLRRQQEQERDQNGDSSP